MKPNERFGGLILFGMCLMFWVFVGVYHGLPDLNPSTVTQTNYVYIVEVEMD